jgi:hypothetical protein
MSHASMPAGQHRISQSLAGVCNASRKTPDSSWMEKRQKTMPAKTLSIYAHREQKTLAKINAFFTWMPLVFINVPRKAELNLPRGKKSERNMT